MRAAGFPIEFPPEAMAEARAASGAAPAGGLRDLRGLPWTSIDEPSSRDLDQLEAVERAGEDGTRLYVAIADVDRWAPAGSALDSAAARRTTSVYAASKVYPMLPPELSFGASSLLLGEDRAALVFETLLGPEGEAFSGQVYPALVRSRAKLDYPTVSAWLDGTGAEPAALADPELRRQVEVQDRLAALLTAARHRAGALDFEAAQARVVLDAQGRLSGVAARRKERAGVLIEELMVASNRTAARWMDAQGLPSLRRVVRRPKHWDRIVAYAAEQGGALPAEPDSKALCAFLGRVHGERPEAFPELSLAVIKMIGRGEYSAHRPGDPELGHFGLAAEQYTHATAPNRRYPDLLLQRGLKRSHAYSFEELQALAAHCSEREAAAEKVERRLRKAAAALTLAPLVGGTFSALVTGVGEKGTFVRVESPWAEGRLTRGGAGAKVGQRLRVRLEHVSPEQGHIDFSAA